METKVNDYLHRTIDYELDELMPELAAIALDGPKGVGKTGTAERRSARVIKLDLEPQRALVENDPEFTTQPGGTIFLDEWQYYPPVWNFVRRQVDAGAAPGRFLLAGSATPVDASGTHSGAGRIVSLRMRPMGLHERGLETPTVSLNDLLNSPEPAAIEGETSFAIADYAAAIASSGFPDIMGMSLRSQRIQLDSYLQRVIDRDLPDQGLTVRSPETLKRWMAAYAAASSTTASYSRILDAATGGDGMQLAKTTTLRYRDHLAQLWLLDPVPGWTTFRNPLKRVAQSPKHQLADPALALRLLGLSSPRLLSESGAHMFGPLFESLVTLGVRTLAQAAEGRTYHLRMADGSHEVDLIVEGEDGALLAIEVKLSPVVTDRDVQHLHWLKEKMQGQVSDLVVINTGAHAYRRLDGVAVVPLALLGF